MRESPETFGSLPPVPNEDRVGLSKFVPWLEFNLKYGHVSEEIEKASVESMHEYIKKMVG